MDDDGNCAGRLSRALAEQPNRKFGGEGQNDAARNEKSGVGNERGRGQYCIRSSAQETRIGGSGRVHEELGRDRRNWRLHRGQGIHT